MQGFEAFKRMQTNKNEPVDSVATLILFTHFNKWLFSISQDESTKELQGRERDLQALPGMLLTPTHLHPPWPITAI